MPRIQLRVYIAPGQIDVFCRLKFKNGIYRPFAAIIDTGASVSLFPARLLDDVEYVSTESKPIIIDQAGIARQAFGAIEAVVTITLEDINGNSTQPFKISAWFADTDELLLGFAGVLDRSVL